MHAHIYVQCSTCQSSHSCPSMACKPLNDIAQEQGKVVKQVGERTIHSLIFLDESLLVEIPFGASVRLQQLSSVKHIVLPTFPPVLVRGLICGKGRTFASVSTHGPLNDSIDEKDLQIRRSSRSRRRRRATHDARQAS